MATMWFKTRYSCLQSAYSWLNPSFHLLIQILLKLDLKKKKKKKLDLMRHFSPCVGTVLSFGNSNFFLLQIFYNNTMRSTTLFPHAMSYVPTKNLWPGHCYLFCTFEICFLRSKVDLTCTVLGSLIIMNVKMTRSLCSQDYHYT